MAQQNDWWELTNAQRRCFGIAPVGAAWKCLRLPRSMYDNYDTALYMEGDRVRHVVLHGELYHREYAVDETLSADGAYIMPKRSSKPIKLTAAAIVKRKAVGMCLLWERRPRSAGRCMLFNETRMQFFYDSYRAGEAVDTPEDFRVWVSRWQAETTEDDQADMDAFTAQPMKTVKPREGDVFRFRWNRRLWGYGRILLDYDRMRREKIPFFDCLMTKPLAVQIFRIVTEDRGLSVEQVLAEEAIPSQNIMDNAVHYGEFEIIGHAPLPEDRDALCPIMYGVGRDRSRLLRFQQGRTYRELPGEAPVGARDYMNSAVGWHPNVTLPKLLDCIREGDAPYWAAERWYSRDLRNPAYAEDLAAVRRQMGV